MRLGFITQPLSDLWQLLFLSLFHCAGNNPHGPAGIEKSLHLPKRSSNVEQVFPEMAELTHYLAFVS